MKLNKGELLWVCPHCERQYIIIGRCLTNSGHYDNPNYVNPICKEKFYKQLPEFDKRPKWDDDQFSVDE